jgi:hypothetical protein
MALSTATVSMPSSSMERKYFLEKLNENNYRMWKIKMELTLTKVNVIDIVNGVLQKPTIEPALSEWKMKDLDAKTEIIMHISDRHVDLIKDLESSKEISDTLKDIYAPSDRITKVMSLRHFTTLQMREEDSIDYFINKYYSAYDNASSAGNKIEEDMKIDILLGALPSSWSPFIVVNGADSNLTLQNLISKLKQEDLRRRRVTDQASTDASNMAMVATMRNQKSNFNNFNNFRNNRINSNQHNNNRFQKFGKNHLNNKFQNQRQGALTISKSIICHYCGKAGHIERDCRKKQYDLRNKNKRNYVNANSVYVEDEDEDNNDPFIQAFVSLTQQCEHATNLWLFDTGATHHLTHNRTLLHDYSSLSTPLEVKFGDNGTKLAIGKGIVHLPIDKHKIVSISNVYYVPGFSKKLIISW